MNKLTTQKRAQILGLLCDGMSLRATSRLAGVSINTVTKLLVDVGAACAAYQDAALRKLPSKRIHIDGIWSFTHKKAKDVRSAVAAQEGGGDTWAWTVIDADSKLMVSWLIGGGHDAREFMQDVASRLANRVQLTFGGHELYPAVIEDMFEAAQEGQQHFPPAVPASALDQHIEDDLDSKLINASFMERQNLAKLMHRCHFTSSTNSFSKKVEQHACAVALHFMFHNFCRVHEALQVTPAMQAGVADHVWALEEVVELSN